MKGGISATHGAVTQGEGGNYLPVDNDMRTYSFRNGDVKYTIAGNGYPIVILKKKQWEDILSKNEDRLQEIEELKRIINDSGGRKKKGKAYKKDDYFFSIESNLNGALKYKIFAVCKFLPNGWESYSPDLDNSVCNLVMAYCDNVPSNIYLPQYWKDVLVPHVNSHLVSLRCNLNQRIKSQ